ncbi:MAG: sugar phosphate isomerase/epimerase [SAR202 cluster bacterium]|nr:sugar phosphate isomerase/epimerase [SAR202 cluster bacterium]
MTGPVLPLVMLLDELKMPFGDAIAAARSLGAEYVWFHDGPGKKSLPQMSGTEVDAIGESLERASLKLLVARAASAFKSVHAIDIDPSRVMDNSAYRRDYEDVVRAMEAARRLGVPAVCVFSFAWPGEYTAGKPTWPMRWATRGGIISEGEMERLAAAFAPVMQAADEHEVDVVVLQLSWNYANTTGNFERLEERIASPRLKLMWNPADSVNCGEADVAEAGFRNALPYLHSLHLKDLRVVDGTRNKFDYCAIGEGDVDYPSILRQLRAHAPHAVLSVATHYSAPDGKPGSAMRTNVEHLKRLIAAIPP